MKTHVPRSKRALLTLLIDVLGEVDHATTSYEWSVVVAKLDDASTFARRVERAHRSNHEAEES